MAELLEASTNPRYFTVGTRKMVNPGNISIKGGNSSRLRGQEKHMKFVFEPLRKICRCASFLLSLVLPLSLVSTPARRHQQKKEYRDMIPAPIH